MNRLGVTAKLFLAVTLCTGGMLLVGAHKVSANHLRGQLSPNPSPTTQIPQWAKTVLENCGHDGQSPGFVQWVAPRNAPTASSITVPYGTTSIPLTLHWAAVICYPNSAVPEARLRTMSASSVPAGTFPGFNFGQWLTIGYGAASYQNVGQYRKASRNFNFAPNGGFRTSGVYTLRLDNRVIDRFINGTFLCVANGAQVAGWNYAGCPRTVTPFPIQVNVLPRPVDAGSCTVNSPTELYPSQAFTAAFTATNSGTNGGFVWPVNNGTPQRYRLRELGTWPGAPEQEIRGGQVQSTGFGPILSPGRTASWSSGFTAPAGLGQYTFSWRIYGSNSLDGFHYVGAICTQTINVVEKPYHKVYGGDVFAGAAVGSPCIDTNASLIGWHDDPLRPDAGAGTQLAAMALNTIAFFASGQARDADDFDNLAFANSGVASVGYGGNLGDGNANCAPDYWENATGILNGNRPIGGRNLGMGQRQTIYVNGNAHITGNITYASGSYNGLNQIPSFRLIVRGNIYIAPGVTQLNGLFVAIPTNANNGRVYTCSNGFAPPTLALLNSTCRNRLTVYGSVVADLIKFTRSGGSLRNSATGERYNSGDPAERFIYTPESWLTSDFNGGEELNSIRTLPPVL